MIELPPLPGPSLYSGSKRAASIMIKGIGCLLSGNLYAPILDADTVCARDGVITFVGKFADRLDDDFDAVIDARQTTVLPGLIDSHVHPTLGEYSPRCDQSFWMTHCLHGGVTTMISAGEVHVPGRPVDRVGVKALAIATQRAFARHRPAGIKLLAGAPLLENGLTREDFAEMASAGVKLIGEIGIGSVTNVALAAEMVRWGREFGMKSLSHTGGPSIPSSRLMVAEEILEIDPDVIGHINGGHTALPRKQIQCLCERCNRALEIVHNGNEFAALYVVRIAKEMNRLDRLILGTDAPAGSGVPALGMLRLVSLISSFGELPAEKVVCFSTGNIARLHELNCGLIEVGREADLVIADIAQGSDGATLLESIRLGNLPGIGMVIIDGKPVVHPSRNTPPASRLPSIDSVNRKGYEALLGW
jgi:enamidase